VRSSDSTYAWLFLRHGGLQLLFFFIQFSDNMPAFAIPLSRMSSSVSRLITPVSLGVSAFIFQYHHGRSAGGSSEGVVAGVCLLSPHAASSAWRLLCASVPGIDSKTSRRRKAKAVATPKTAATGSAYYLRWLRYLTQR